jgi:hypothetical protein
MKDLIKRLREDEVYLTGLGAHHEAKNSAEAANTLEALIDDRTRPETIIANQVKVSTIN